VIRGKIVGRYETVERQHARREREAHIVEAPCMPIDRRHAHSQRNATVERGAIALVGDDFGVDDACWGEL